MHGSNNGIHWWIYWETNTISQCGVQSILLPLLNPQRAFGAAFYKPTIFPGIDTMISDTEMCNIQLSFQSFYHFFHRYHRYLKEMKLRKVDAICVRYWKTAHLLCFKFRCQSICWTILKNLFSAGWKLWQYQQFFCIKKNLSSKFRINGFSFSKIFYLSITLS